MLFPYSTRSGPGPGIDRSRRAGGDLLTAVIFRADGGNELPAHVGAMRPARAAAHTCRQSRTAGPEMDQTKKNAPAKNR